MFSAQGGLVFDDADGDGEGDCYDAGTLVCDSDSTLTADDDGTNDLSLTNMDCDDGDATTVGDDDFDDFYVLMTMTVTTVMLDFYTYPGAGFNEAGFDWTLYGMFDRC